MPGYLVSSQPVLHSDEIEKEWCELQDRAECSYFQSWGWIGAWLDKVASDLKPAAIKVWHGKELVGLGIFVQKNIKRHLFVRSNAMFLNECPHDGRNMVIEYNGLLADRSHKAAVYAETLRYLMSEYSVCDEFYFGGMHDVADLVAATGKVENLASIVTEKESAAWQVELAAIGCSVDSYLARLGRNERSQIRRSFRLYEMHGCLSVNEAHDLEEATSYFDGLKDFHTSRWESRGKPGSFANSIWEEFHRALISSRFDKGEIQLLKVSNSRETIGYIYNFVWRGSVYVLQTGFRKPADNRLKPAYVGNSLAILHNRKKGISVYDFMHGDTHYKKRLCNHSRMLYWMVVRRYRLKFGIEDAAMRIYRAGKAFLRSRPAS